jgi:diacylglycerol O-acyltransferase / wax synthase
MAQDHLDRLSAVDAAFLHQEGPATHMHIGGVGVFEGPPPQIERVLEHISTRLSRVPRYRQKLVPTPGGLDRERWIDDPTFNLDYHVRHTALPAPGDDERLRTLIGRLFAQRLDRSKPLWEMWVVEGLADGRWALVSKSHHALVDGVSGADLTTVLFDLSPVPAQAHAEPTWQPRPVPSKAQLLATSLGGAIRAAMELPLHAAAAAAQPGRTLAAAREVAEGLGEVAWAGLNAAPDSPLNVKIGPCRAVAFVPARLEDFKRVKNVFGGTVNDVMLAVVTGALRHWMRQRGMRAEGLELRAGVPVSTRSDADREQLGNRLTQLVAPLPVYQPDAVERLRIVREAMQDVKESKLALGAEAIATAEDFAPPTILAQATKLNFSRRFYNVLVTNIPGPQFPLYLLGRELQGMFPVAFLAGDRALAIAAMSYNGAVNFGLIADPDSLDDLDAVAAGIDAALAELVGLAEKVRPVRFQRVAPRELAPVGD